MLNDKTLEIKRLQKQRGQALDIGEDISAFDVSIAKLREDIATGIVVEFKRGKNPFNYAISLLNGKMCSVCDHPQAKTINGLLINHKPLRVIEAKYGISRSTLSRHYNKCLKGETKQEIFAPLEYMKRSLVIDRCPYCQLDTESKMPFYCLKLPKAKGNIACKSHDFIECPLIIGNFLLL